MIGPIVLHEDQDLAVIDKPAGIATHSPEKDLCWGLQDYLEWVRNDGTRLLIVHRLDRDTSGVLVLAKTKDAAARLARQWEQNEVAKRYFFITRRKPSRDSWSCDQPVQGKQAFTEFCLSGRMAGGWGVEARPRTGRTHQIRIHATASGVPIVGDRPFGETADRWPFLLHASRVEISGRSFEAPVPKHFSAETPEQAQWERAASLRALVQAQGDAARRIHGAADGFPGQIVECYGGRWVLSEVAGVSSPWLRNRITEMGGILKKFKGMGRVEKTGDASGPVIVSEHGLRYEIRFDESTTTGLFLDQRENRLHLRRLLEQGPPGDVLNCFAHTGSFSVVAAAAGRRTVSVDLSARFLEWGKRNFELNGLDATAHVWLKGDAAGCIRRLGKRGEKFAAVILDPPSFARGKQGDFKAERDLPKLVESAAGLIVPGGALLAATNLRKWVPAVFLKKVLAPLRETKYSVRQIPMPPDFPHQAGEELWMKSVWITL